MIDVNNLQEIRRAAAETGRDITLIAAVKTQSKDTVDEFMKLAPEFVLGENRVQEFRDKYDENYRWHIIGQLQTNKVKYVVGKAELIHSLDRLELADEIERQAAKRNVVQDCLIEVNMGAEITKGGVAPSDAVSFLRAVDEYPHIAVKGIMSVLPNLNDKNELCALYDKLYSVYNECAEAISGYSLKRAEMKYLSAGMSNDYKIALAHGANMIRLGRIIFGERVYKESEIK